MRQNTALAMLGSTNDISMFDFATYARCKRVLQIKDAEIARLYRDRICDTTQEATTYVLDVGSSEGSLLNKIFRHMNGQAHQPFVIDCVEPDGSGLPHLRHIQSTFDRDGITLNIVQKRIQDVLLYPQSVSYDIILCTHLFYHIPREQWHTVVKELLAALNTNGGILFVCLVSFESDIYRVWDRIASRVVSEGLPRRFDEDGEFIFAEHMRAFLQQEGIEAKSHTIGATFKFSRRDCKEYTDRAARGTVEASFIIQFLAYMLRLHPTDVAHVYHNHDIMESCKQAELAFRSIDYIFEIRTFAS